MPGAAPFTPELTGADQLARMGQLYDAVADEVASRIRANTVPAVVSGDCLMALGVLTGVQRAGVSPSILWLDAHGDVHTPETSTSGYLGGMALRFLLGAAPGPLAEKLGLRPLAEESATLVDARDLDPAEVEYLATAKVRRVPVSDVEAPEGPVILHVDVDVLDSGELPGLRFPAADGPAKAELLRAVGRILDGGNVVAVHIACPWFPGQEQEIRAQLLAELLDCLSPVSCDE